MQAAAIERHLRDLHARYPARVIADVTVRSGRTLRRALPGPEVVCHGAFFEPSRPEGRQALASALFTKLEVEGYQKMTYELTPDAIDLGLGAALPARLETGGQIGGFGRGERGSASLTHLSARPRFVLENVTGPRGEWPVDDAEGRRERPTASDPATARGPAGVHRGWLDRCRGPRAGHQRDDGAPAPVWAVPADGCLNAAQAAYRLGMSQLDSHPDDRGSATAVKLARGRSWAHSGLWRSCRRVRSPATRRASQGQAPPTGSGRSRSPRPSP